MKRDCWGIPTQMCCSMRFRMHCWVRWRWGDIGKHFPDTDPAYAGADSLKLLELVVEKVKAQGYAVGNLDATILCQKPKLAPYIVPMREKIAAACGVSVEQVSVKATTEEKLGFTGEGLGISAHCVCLLVKA